MFKRILAFVMCAAMVLSFASCSEEKDLNIIAENETRSTNAPITLSIFVPSMTKLEEETRVAVEKALNAISIKKYNTKLKFYAYPEEEYIPIVLSMVKSKMDTFVTNKIHSLPPEERADCPEVSVDYPTNKVINLADMTNYPELNDANIDIFVAFTPDKDSPIRLESSGEFYNEYIADNFFQVMYDQRVLAPISPRLINDYAILKSKSYDEFDKLVTRSDIDDQKEGAKQYTYAMPNNYIVGYCNYLIIDDAAVNGVYTQAYTKLSGNKNALNQLVSDLAEAKAWAEQKLAEAPVEATDATEDGLDVKKFEKLLAVTDIYKEFDSYKAYEDYKSDNKTCAVAMVKDNYALPEVFDVEGYSIVNYSSECTVDEYATSMYCITRAYDFSLAGSDIDEDDRILRCLDILMLIQNDVEFRNTLQYGVKGEHYSITRDGSVTTSAVDYVMDPSKIGNMFLLYPSDQMSESMRKLAENNWRIGKLQNKEMIELAEELKNNSATN